MELEHPAILGHPGDTQSLPSRNSLSPTMRGTGQTGHLLGPSHWHLAGQGGQITENGAAPLLEFQSLWGGGGRQLSFCPHQELCGRGVWASWSWGLAGAWRPHQRGPRYREQKPMLWGAAPPEQVPQPSTMGREGASAGAPCPGLGTSLLSWYISTPAPSALTPCEGPLGSPGMGVWPEPP